MLAEAMVQGRIGRQAFSRKSLVDEQTRSLADRVLYTIDENFPGPEQFRGEVRIRLRGGSELTAIEQHNRGSSDNPMSIADLKAKFTENATPVLSPAQIEQLGHAVLNLETCQDARQIVELAVGRLDQ